MTCGLRPPADALLIADRRLVVDGGVAAVRVVPALDELDDGEARLDLGGEAPPVEELALERREDALTEGGYRRRRRPTPLTGGRRPRGTEGRRSRTCTGCPGRNDVRRAPTPSGDASPSPTDHAGAPDIEDDGEIEETAQVGMYVMSATQSRSGPAAVSHQRWAEYDAIGQSPGAGLILWREPAPPSWLGTRRISHRQPASVHVHAARVKSRHTRRSRHSPA
jgi:hypothetical protein